MLLDLFGMADHIGPISHLNARDVAFVLVSRASLLSLLAYRERMGWSLPWVSSGRWGRGLGPEGPVISLG
jgi:predicted dithiol-disulfide oxidoreductase (DUF899 family)